MELLVSLALGGFLVLGVVNVFLTTKESSSVEAALARVQESGRFAMDVLADDLRRANYTGCNSVTRSADILITDFNHVGVRGYMRRDGSWSEALDANDPSLVTIATVEDQIRPGTDVLNLHLATHVGRDILQSDVTQTDRTFNISENPGCQLEDGDAVILANCLTAHVFMADVTPTSCNDPAAVTTITMNGENTFDNPEGYIYTDNTDVLKFESVTWFVGDTGRQREGETVYALYRQSLAENPEEMIEGVEFMQILYGQRGGSANNPSTRYVNAADADLRDSWDEVVSVRIGLLVQNYDPVRDQNDPITYVLADPNTPIAPADHGGGLVLRQAFRTTTALRNTDYNL